MFGLTAATRIYLYRGVCNMRKSFDGLCGIVRSDLGADPLSGSLFVFVNRRRTLGNPLYWAPSRPGPLV
jgi:transposase